MKNVAPAVPAELAQEGIRQLTQARSAAMGSIAGELQAILPAAIAASPNSVPEGIPEWVAGAFAEARAADGASSWKTVRAALARRTADLIASTVLAEGITGGSLAGFLGLDLLAFSDEGWAAIEPVGSAMAGESK